MPKYGKKTISVVAHLELHSPVGPCLLPLLFNINRSLRLVHPRWVGSSMLPPCVATGVIPQGPSGPETTPAEYPHSKHHQSSHKIWCQKQMVSVSWVAEGVRRQGPSHCWVDSFLLSWSHCIGTMNVAVPFFSPPQRDSEASTKSVQCTGLEAMGVAGATK